MAGVKLQLHDVIYRLRFYSNLLIHILSLSNLYNNIAPIQKNRGDISHRVIEALDDDDAICPADSFEFTIYHCMRLNALRHE